MSFNCLLNPTQNSCMEPQLYLKFRSDLWFSDSLASLCVRAFKNRSRQPGFNCCCLLTPVCPATCNTASDFLVYRMTAITAAVRKTHLLETNDHLLDFKLGFSPLREKTKATNFRNTSIDALRKHFLEIIKHHLFV